MVGVVEMGGMILFTQERATCDHNLQTTDDDEDGDDDRKEEEEGA